MKRTTLTLATLMGLGTIQPAYAGLNESDVHDIVPAQIPADVLTLECETWMDNNTTYIDNTFCNEDDVAIIAKSECGTESMDWILNKIPGDNNLRSDYNNWACQTIDLATFGSAEDTLTSGLARKFLCNGDETNVCVYTAPVAEVNHAPVVTLNAGGRTVEQAPGNVDYVFSVIDEDAGDTWEVAATITKDGSTDELTKIVANADGVIVSLDSNLAAGEYQITLKATDNHGLASEPNTSSYKITKTAPAAAPAPPAVAAKVQTADFRLGYTAMFQPGFDQRSHGLQASAAFPLAETSFKLVPGLRWGRLSGGDTRDAYTEDMDPTHREGSEYIESMPDMNNPNETLDIEMRYVETSEGSTTHDFKAPTRGHDLQAQLYLEFPSASKTFAHGSLAAAIQAGFSVGKTWGQDSNGTWNSTRDYTTEASLWTVDNAGNEELFQDLDPVFDTQSRSGSTSKDIKGYGYAGIGARVMLDATLNNGLGVYANGDFGLRMGGDGVSLDAGAGAGLVYKRPLKE
ncbi:hypothetical protein HOA92_07120 [archaeon]|jgi:hypothetical protein|nr:hypothetical protein [archaeon]MBT6762783.1 hypothetical protein [archaeon]